MQTNYLHICNNDLKCKCGWTGCICQVKLDIKVFSINNYEMLQLCPECKETISSSTLTHT